MTTAQSSATAGQRAILLMVAAILCFSLMDVAVKAVTPRIGVVPAIWTRFAGQTVLVLAIVAPRLSQVARTAHPWLQLARSLLLLGATGFFFTAISRIPLANAAALMAVNPLFISLGAALFLNEPLGPRRIAAIAVAMCGALLILQPGGDTFSVDAILPVFAALSYSGYALITRRVGRDEDAWTSLLYTALVGTLVLCLIVPFHWQTPDRETLILMIPIVVMGTAGHLFLIRAFTQGEAAMLAPYSYVGLVFATLWGLLFFGEWPGLATLAGAIVIAGSGLYVWHRETLSLRT